MNARLADARATAIDARARLDRFAATPPGDDAESASPAIQGLRRQMTDLARRDAELATRYGRQYPDRTAMRAQIGAIAREITAERARMLKTLRAEADVATAREAALRQSLDSTRTEDVAPQGAASDHAIRLRELERRVEADKTIYETALERLRQTREMEQLAGPEARIMSPASSGSGQQTLAPPVLLALAGAAGALAGFGVAAMREWLKDPCLGAGQTANDLGLPRIAEAPHLGRGARKARGHIMHPATVVAMRPLSRFAEGFRAVRTTLDAAGPTLRPAGQPAPNAAHAHLETRRGNIVLVTSSQSGDGKTTTAIGLALSLAEAGHRVALVDGDLRKAGLTAFFGLRTQPGLAEMLRDAAPFATASVRRANLVIIPAGAMAGMGARPLSLIDAPTAPLLRRMALAFDQVIVDGPPWM